MDNLPIPEHERIGLVGAQTTGPDTPKVIGGAGGTSPVMGDAGADLLAEMEGKPPTSLDDDYRHILERRNSDDNLKWLEDQVGPLVDEPPVEPEGAGIMDTAGKIAKDIGGGLMEAPKQAVGGAIGAVNEAWDLIDQAATWLNNNVADTRLGTLTGEQMAPPQAGQVGELPNVGAPETVTGGFVRGISQFLTGFAGAGKVTGIKNSLPGVFGKSMIADFAAFDGQEANLANFIQQFPTLQNPVTEFLSTDQETPEMIGRMKNALTGLGAGAALEPFVQVLRAFRAARKAKELSGEADYASAAKKLAEAGPDDPTLGASPQTGERIRQALGDPDAPLVQVQEEIFPTGDAYAAKALDQTTGGGVGAAEAPATAADGGGAMQPPSAPPAATGAPPPQGPPPGGARLDFGPRQVYVNLARINSTDDVKAVVTQMADAFGDDIAKAQRGVRSNATTAAAAGDENAWQLLEGKRKADAPKVATAEEQLVLRNLWAQSSETLKGLAKVAADGGPEDLVAFRRAVETHRMIQNTVVGIRTETARALQQWRIPAGGSKEMERQLADVLANTGGEAASRDMAAKVAALADHPNGGPALESFVDRLGRGAQLTVDVVREYWINSILSGPKTHAVNMMSNAAVFFQSLGERALAGQMGDLVNPVYGVKPGEASAMLYGALEAQKDAWRAAAHALKTGETGMGRTKTLESARRRAMSAESFGVSSDSMLGRGLDYAGGFVNIPGRMLTAADDYFKMVNYRAQIHALALREASTEIERGMLPREGLKARIAELVDDPPERFRLMANDYAAYNTFTNEAGPIAKAAMKVRDTVPGGWLAMPFINTPANLFTYAFERSPAALMMKNRFWAEVQAGGARRDMALAKMGLGTMAFTAAFDLAVNGHITGGGPSGDKAAGERQARARVGWQPYSIRVQTGTEADGKPVYRYFAYNRFDPVGTLFANAADLGEYFLNSSDGRIDTRDAAEVAAMMVFGTAENLKDKAFFRGFADAVAAVNNPERYGERWLQNAIGGFVPTIVKDAARAMDPVSRETTDLVSALKNRTPGLSADMPPRLDFWGKPMQFQSGLGTAYDILSPVYSRSTAGKMDPAEKAFFELKYFPTHPSSIQIGGQYVSLRNMPEFENRLVELTNAKASDLVSENTDALMEQKGGGRAALRRLEAHGDSTLREALNATVSSPEFAAADPEERQDMLSDVLSDYRRAAKLQVLREFPRLHDIRDSIPPRGTGAQLPY